MRLKNSSSIFHILLSLRVQFSFSLDLQQPWALYKYLFFSLFFTDSKNIYFSLLVLILLNNPFKTQCYCLFFSTFHLSLISDDRFLFGFLTFFHSLLFRIFNPKPCHDHIVYLLSSSFLWFFFPLERLHWFILRFVYGIIPPMYFVSSFYIIQAIVSTRKKFCPCLPRKGQTKTLWEKETHNRKIVKISEES